MDVKFKDLCELQMKIHKFIKEHGTIKGLDKNIPFKKPIQLLLKETNGLSQ